MDWRVPLSVFITKIANFPLVVHIGSHTGSRALVPR